MGCLPQGPVLLAGMGYSGLRPGIMVVISPGRLVCPFGSGLQSLVFWSRVFIPVRRVISDNFFLPESMLFGGRGVVISLFGGLVLSLRVESVQTRY